MPDTSLPETDHDDHEDLGDDGTLVVEDHSFAIVGEWVITSELSDAAFRVYCMLLRYGGTTGCRMPSRALLGRRLHRSVDSIDRALRELVSTGIVRIEHRHDGRQYRSNRYHVRTTSPSRPAAPACAEGGGRRTAATPATGEGSGRTDAVTPGRRSAARVAAELRPYPEVPTQRTPPPPPSAVATGGDRDLLANSGIEDLQALSGRCVDLRSALGRPTARWTPKCLAVAIKLAIVRGWPSTDVEAALLAVAADPDTRSPARLAEAGPWWDNQAEAATTLGAAEDLADLEARLAELGGQRPARQARARAELVCERMPLTRATVTRRAVAILDRQDQPA